MPAKAGIQDTSMLAEFRLLATPARCKPCAAASRPAGYPLSGYDNMGFPDRCALCFLLAKRSNDGWGIADPFDSIVIGRRLTLD